MPRIYRISGAARRAGVCSSTIRNYERRGLIVLQGDESGQRVFDDKSIRRIKQVYFRLNLERI